MPDTKVKLTKPQRRALEAVGAGQAIGTVYYSNETKVRDTDTLIYHRCADALNELGLIEISHDHVRSITLTAEGSRLLWPNTSLCDPGLHDGAKVAAEYMVREAIEVDGRYEVASPQRNTMFGLRMYACCGEHVGVAVAYVMQDGARHAVVRREP